MNDDDKEDPSDFTVHESLDSLIESMGVSPEDSTKMAKGVGPKITFDMHFTPQDIETVFKLRTVLGLMMTGKTIGDVSRIIGTAYGILMIQEALAAHQMGVGGPPGGVCKTAQDALAKAVEDIFSQSFGDDKSGR